jgi:hypothetical protein
VKHAYVKNIYLESKYCVKRPPRSAPEIPPIPYEVAAKLKRF